MKNILLMLVCGLLLSSCSHDPVVPSQDISFRKDVMLIIATNCQQSGCHGAVDFEKFQLITYDDVINNGDIKAGNAKGSKLYKAISGTGEDLMPPGGKLTDEQLYTIKFWIEQGAKDN